MGGKVFFAKRIAEIPLPKGHFDSWNFILQFLFQRKPPQRLVYGRWRGVSAKKNSKKEPQFKWQRLLLFGMLAWAIGPSHVGMSGLARHAIGKPCQARVGPSMPDWPPDPVIVWHMQSISHHKYQRSSHGTWQYLCALLDICLWIYWTSICIQKIHHRGKWSNYLLLLKRGIINLILVHTLEAIKSFTHL